ncbi:HPr-rel-A system PqqD family peptide chaperone [Allosphingosinicella sp.]|uniref:HPr-rel-A system PqqD family peptide chaperone n=1 Tax=Allosphingosinicella sp. TaxID=2823234 RepID=UPI002FC2528C
MPGPRFVADPPEWTRRVEMGGLTALFHIPSGMTHLLAAPAPQILDVIANNPGDAAEILSRMTVDFDVDGGEDAILARLAELEASGLVSRV